MLPEFPEFQKIPRLSRECVVTEKIDGTNGLIFITEGGDVYAGSRTRWITPADDNYGFAKWVEENKVELLRLGPGRHYGEWWGQGIQRNYSQARKRFSLFNVSRWRDAELRPAVCDVVPVLYEGPLEEYGVLKGVKSALARLQKEGSVAAPGFMNPEGIVLFHVQANQLFKKTIERDEEWKGRRSKTA